jgi:Uma2 family endonuclease
VTVAEQLPMVGPHTVEDWLASDPPADGSRLELILGYFHVTPAPGGEHQFAAYRLTRLLEDSLRAAGLTDLYAVPAVNVEVSTTWRTGLIPDVVVLNRKPVGASFKPEDLVVVVEVWSPGNTPAERETKMIGYAAAGVTYVWTLTPDSHRGPVLTTYTLEGGTYAETDQAHGNNPTPILAFPVPIALNLVDLTA